MTLRVERFHDVAAYVERVGPFMIEREGDHNLIFGITAGIMAYPEIAEEPPYLAAVVDGDGVVMASIRTPPYRVVLGEIDDTRFLAPLAADLADHPAGIDLPGVMGPVPGVEAFADLWAEQSGRTARLTQTERIFRLEHVRPVRRPSGSMRPITEADRSLAFDWLVAFAREAVPDDPVIDAEGVITRAFRSVHHGLRLWQDRGRPTSLAGFGGPTPNGIRVGPVYTPPEHRGRGYATALVADLSAERLAAGRRFCFLFTDLANPTSNHIYQEIGYEPVRDVAVWQFRDPGPASSP